MTRRPDSSAGTRYANVLPVPVPASTISRPRERSASATCSAIAICSSRVAKPGIAVASGPSDPEQISS